MKQLLVLLTCIFLVSNSAIAQQKYPVVIQFNSHCCGVPSDTPLVKYINDFRKKFHRKSIYAIRISPMGREGEYWLAFSLTNMKRDTRLRFIQGLETLIPTLTDQGAANLVKDLEIQQADLPPSVQKKRIRFR